MQVRKPVRKGTPRVWPSDPLTRHQHSRPGRCPGRETADLGRRGRQGGGRKAAGLRRRYGLGPQCHAAPNVLCETIRAPLQFQRGWGAGGIAWVSVRQTPPNRPYLKLWVRNRGPTELWEGASQGPRTGSDSGIRFLPRRAAVWTVPSKATGAGMPQGV